jgi:hypothetical protein
MDESSLSDMSDRLEGWVRAALISEEQAASIRKYEAMRSTVVPGPAKVGTAGQAGVRRIPLYAEAIGYLGAALALGAVFSGVGRVWTDLSVEWRAALLGIGFLIVFVAGLLLRSSAEPVLQRLRSVLWFIAVMAFAGFVGEVAGEVVGTAPLATSWWVIGASALLALALWADTRSGPQHVAMFLTLAAAAADLTNTYGNGRSAQIGAAVWLFSALWITLSYTDLVSPRSVGFGLGALGVLIAPTAINDYSEAFGLTVGICSAIALMVMSVFLRENVMLALGGVGSFIYIVAIIQQFFRGTVGVPITLLICGVALIVIAVLMARFWKRPGAGATHLLKA